MKIAILGYSGSGKSTLAGQLGQRYQIPVLYLDTVQFVAGWKERDRTQALEMVDRFMQQENWVIDGNYTAFRQQERLEQADHIVILSFARLPCLWRAYKRLRTYRHTTRESMAPGCEEKMDAAFVWWLLYGGRKKERRARFAAIRRRYPEKCVVLKNQKQLDAFRQAPFA